MILAVNDLYITLSRRQNEIDKDMTADVNDIMFKFYIKNEDKIVWIPGRTNII